MTALPIRAPFEGRPSVYYATSDVECDVETAWEFMLDYQAWNPTFIGATVTHVTGPVGDVGEIVEISKQLIDPTGQKLPVFYAETVMIVPQRHFVWYVYTDEGEPLRNFVDFGLTPEPFGCRFDTYYYAQNQVPADDLAAWREFQQVHLDASAIAFKEYCEVRAGSILHP